jgi:hypothetical protein
MNYTYIPNAVFAILRLELVLQLFQIQTQGNIPDHIAYIQTFFFLCVLLNIQPYEKKMCGIEVRCIFYVML